MGYFENCNGNIRSIITRRSIWTRYEEYFGNLKYKRIERIAVDDTLPKRTTGCVWKQNDRKMYCELAPIS